MRKENIPYGGYYKGVFEGIRDVDDLRLTLHVCCFVMSHHDLCPDVPCNECPCQKEFEEALLKCD